MYLSRLISVLSKEDLVWLTCKNMFNFQPIIISWEEGKQGQSWFVVSLLLAFRLQRCREIAGNFPVLKAGTFWQLSLKVWYFNTAIHRSMRWQKETWMFNKAEKFWQNMASWRHVTGARVVNSEPASSQSKFSQVSCVHLQHFIWVIYRKGLHLSSPLISQQSQIRLL